MNSIIEAGRQELARRGFEATYSHRFDGSPKVDGESAAFYDYRPFNRAAIIHTDKNGQIQEIYAGNEVDTFPYGYEEWQVHLRGEEACQEFLRCAAEWKSPQVMKARETIARESILSVLDSLAEGEITLAPWVNEQDPSSVPHSGVTVWWSARLIWVRSPCDPSRKLSTSDSK